MSSNNKYTSFLKVFKSSKSWIALAVCMIWIVLLAVALTDIEIVKGPLRYGLVIGLLAYLLKDLPSHLMNTVFKQEEEEEFVMEFSNIDLEEEEGF